MTLFKAISKSAFLVRFDKLGQFYFTEKSGGSISAESSQVPNGSGNKIFQIVGPSKVENVTLKAPYDPNLMGLLEPIILKFSCEGGEIIITPVDCQGTIGSQPSGYQASIAGLPDGLIPTPVGEPYRYLNARIIKYMPPDVDRKSADVAMFEIELVADEMIRGTSAQKLSNPGIDPSITGTFSGLPSNATIS